MLKYPSVQATKGKGTKKLLTNTQSEKHSLSKVKLRASESQTFFERAVTVTWREFMAIAFVWETPLFQIVYFVDLLIHWGRRKTFVTNCIFEMILAAPIAMSLLLLGSYTKKGYFHLWQMLPILQGMFWAVSVFSIVLEFFNIAIAGLALQYVAELLTKTLPWMNCKFKEATEKCYSMYPLIPYEKKCPTKLSPDFVNFPAYEYFLYNIMRVPYSDEHFQGIGKLQIPWVGTVGLTWFLMFVLLSLEFVRYRNIVMIANYVLGTIFFIATIGLTVFVSSKLAWPFLSPQPVETYVTFEYWLSLMTFSLSRKMPGNYITLGSMAPMNMVPNVIVFYISVVKFFGLLFLMILLSTSVQLLYGHYKIVDIKCIRINGLLLLFTIIPDILARVSFAQLVLLLYFFGMWLYGFFSALLTMNALYESLCQCLPRINSVRVYFIAILCTVCCLLNMTLLTNSFFSMMDTWRELSCKILTITMMFLFCCGIFVYSIEKLFNDYYFMHDKPLRSFWENSLKITFCIMFFSVAMLLSQNVNYSFYYIPSTSLKVLCYIFVAIVLVPIIGVAIFVYLNYKNKGIVRSPLSPTPLWGPLTAASKQARSMFNPQRDIQYKYEEQKCRHNCLLNSQKVTEEIELLNKNRWRLIKLFEDRDSSE